MNSPPTPTPAPPRPSLLKTPLRDLIRGRVTGRLDVPARIAPLRLPSEVADRCLRISRYTRFKRIPRADLAVSLCDHAAMQIEAGWKPEEVLADLGDAKQRGREIRRQARAKRTLGRRLFDAMRAAAVVGFGVSLCSYGYAFARFHLSHPVIKRNISQEWSAPWSAVPEEQRAATMYKRAVAAMPAQSDEKPPRKWPDAKPTDPDWAQFAAHVRQYQPALAIARDASKMSVLGLTLTDGVDNGWQRPGAGPWDLEPATPNPFVLDIKLPHLGKLREFARIAAADARLAAEEGDSARAEADLISLMGFAHHAREMPSLICQLVGIAALALQVDTICDLLEGYPGLLNDSRLARISQCIAAYPGDGPFTPRLNGEEGFLDDVLQRAYTDDGTCEGRLCFEGLRNWDRMMKGSSSVSFGSVFFAPVNSLRFASRKEMKAEWRWLAEQLEKECITPPWQRLDSACELRQEQIDSDPHLRIKFAVLSPLLPAFGKARDAFDQIKCRRDGTLIAIALERYRLANGGWPESLAQLEPRFLASVPADPFDGKPFKYILRPEGPLVYSVGADGDDDGGSPPPGRMGNVSASRWRRNVQNAPNGDFVAWPIPPEPKRASEEEEGGG